jgi:hypothetical protein
MFMWKFVSCWVLKKRVQRSALGNFLLFPARHVFGDADAGEMMPRNHSTIRDEWWCGVIKNVALLIRRLSSICILSNFP